jgi:hypothetical protein
MCLYAFLYFTEFSTVNINYFCNQKNTHTHTHTLLLEGKKTPSPFNFSRVFTPLTEKYHHSIPQMEREEDAGPSFLCDAGHSSQKTTDPQ